MKRQNMSYGYVAPLLFSDGIHLFRKNDHKIQLTLIDSQAFNQFMQLRYHVKYVLGNTFSSETKKLSKRHRPVWIVYIPIINQLYKAVMP